MDKSVRKQIDAHSDNGTHILRTLMNHKYQILEFLYGRRSPKIRLIKCVDFDVKTTEEKPEKRIIQTWPFMRWGSKERKSCILSYHFH